MLNDPEAVATFADCLRSMGAAYREGLDPNLEDAIGIDTNYVEAMEQGASHLPADSVRPSMILFTDGRHDVAGVPNREVAEAHERLFGDRSPFALLPVGMGLAAGDRNELTAGLEDLRVVRDMPPCVSGTTFEWPEVVFDSAGAAGNAVAEALQAATCTFTVAPTEPPVTPAPPAAPGVVGNIQLTPGDGFIDVAWSPPAQERRPSPTTAPAAPATTGRSSPPKACRRNRGPGRRAGAGPGVPLRSCDRHRCR